MQPNDQNQSSQIRIRKARYADIDALKKPVARAFDKDPFVNWVVLQDGKRTKRIELFFETGAKHLALRYEHIFTTEDFSGVAMWYPPEPKNCWKSSTLKDLSLMHKWIAIMGIRQMPSRMSGHELIKKHHLKNMEEPHFYLEVMAVDPAHQRKGIGSRLVHHGLSMCNEKGVPAYLETGLEENVRFYQKHAFRVIEEFTLPKGPKSWAMIYEPK